MSESEGFNHFLISDRPIPTISDCCPLQAKSVCWGYLHIDEPKYSIIFLKMGNFVIKRKMLNKAQNDLYPRDYKANLWLPAI